jgi:chromosome segregation ATPase
MKTHTDRLEQLRESAAAERGALGAIEAELDAAQVAAQRAREGLVRAHTDGKQLPRAYKARDAADAQVDLLKGQVGFARQRISQATREAERYEREHAGDLVDELAPDAARVVDDLQRAASELVAADREWQLISARVNQLLAQVQDRSLRGSDAHALAPVARDVRRALAGGEPIASPLPPRAERRAVAA